MKRIRGTPLDEVLRALREEDAEMARRFSRRKLLSAFASVCLAIDFAHQRGVLHRDIKPANVMLGDFGEVYVLDWGLARLSHGAEPDAPAGAAPPSAQDGATLAQTVDGQMMGTPGYMAPEQVLGEVARLTPRTDVYALGALLFEILTLSPLHRGEALGALIASTLHGVDARPGARRPDLEIAPELDRLCVQATALDPADRCASARTLHEAVERHLDGDRDLALRRQMAEAHVRAAQEAAGRALGGALDAAGAERERVRAMGEVSRALALEPANRDAARILMRLLTEPPRQMPAEAEAQLRRSSLEAVRSRTWPPAWPIWCGCSGCP